MKSSEQTWHQRASKESMVSGFLGSISMKLNLLLNLDLPYRLTVEEFLLLKKLSVHAMNSIICTWVALFGLTNRLTFSVFLCFLLLFTFFLGGVGISLKYCPFLYLSL